jgi:hypothetical protein
VSELCTFARVGLIAHRCIPFSSTGSPSVSAEALPEKRPDTTMTQDVAKLLQSLHHEQAEQNARRTNPELL